MMMFKNVSLGLLSAMVLIGCVAETEDVDAGTAELSQEEATREIVDNLKLAGYPDAEIEVTEDGEVIAGGDAVVTLGASREMIGLTSREEEGDEDHFRQYRTNNLVSPAVSVICIDGSRYTGTLSTALNNAIASYNAENLSFSMVRTSGSNAGCNAEITAYKVNGGGGSAGFPAGGLPYHAINIGKSVANYGVSVATHVIAHELGHCIGFRHTDYFNRSISCGSGGNEGSADVGAVHIPGTPVGAVMNGSVMNSCFNGGSTGQWTASDETALAELYGGGGGGGGGGGDPDPMSCEDNNACGGQAPGGCYCDAACVNYGDCCSDGPC